MLLGGKTLLELTEFYILFEISSSCKGLQTIYQQYKKG
jgi:hypothetical protein